MGDPAIDDDVQFGLVALRRGINVDALAVAIESRAAGQGRSLGRMLVELKVIDEQELKAIEWELKAQQGAGADADSTITVAPGSASEVTAECSTLEGLRDLVLHLRKADRRYSGGETDLDSTLAAEMTQADPGVTAPLVVVTDLEATIAVTTTDTPTATLPAAPVAAGRAEATVGAQTAAMIRDASTVADPGATVDVLDATQAMTPSLPSRPSLSSLSTGGIASSLKGPSRPRFRIIREHARGGLGEVFVALDEELNREVALKEIQGKHADNLESRSRFLIEAEVTGGLEHPGIVPVYGLGQYPDGRPYYAMRFIRGQSLKEAAARFHQADAADPKRDPGQREIELRELLTHFLNVCHAMAYSHARGVIHRDLKPANIMLGAFGETLVVDWGLAKTLDGPASAMPEVSGVPPLRPLSGSVRSETLYGSTIGTPQFMSPEQAAGLLDEMGPPSDIYSLGATLYAVLTGGPPFRERNVLVLLDQVKKGQFPNPREVNPRVPAALAAVCMKAMALAPTARYPSTRDLADDIVRWLADEPVSVYREPWTTRAARWARRHKTSVAVATALLLTGSVSLGIGTILIEREQKRTAAVYGLATNAVDDLLNQVGEIDLAEIPQMEPVRRLLLDRALGYYQVFLKETRNDAITRFEVSRAHVRLAEIDELLGRYPSAEKNYREAIKILEALVAADPNRQDYRRDLGRAEHGLGVMLRKSNRFIESEKEFRKALALRKTLPGKEGRAAYVDTLYHLGALLAKLSKRDSEVAEAYNTAESEMKALSAADPNAREYRQKRARYLNNIGIFASPSDPAKARKAFADAVDLDGVLSKESPGVSAYRWGLARAQNGLASMDREGKVPDPTAARTNYSAALENFTRLADDFPAVPDYRSEQAQALTNLAALKINNSSDRKRNDPLGALPDLEKAEALLKHLTDEFPQRPDYRHKRAQVQTRRGIAQIQAGQLEPAAASLRQAAATLRQLVKDFPEVPEYESDLGLVLHNLAQLYENQKVLAANEDVLLEAIDHQRKAVAASGRNEKYREYLAGDLIFLGSHRLTHERYGEAAKLAAEVPELAPENLGLKVKAAMILGGCLGRLETEGTPSAGDATPTVDYERMVLQILEEAVKKERVRPEDLDREDFHSLQKSLEFQRLRKELRQKAVVPKVG